MFKRLLFLGLAICADPGIHATTVQWGTYLGGLNRDYGTAIATDRQGNIYVAGNTASTLGISTTGSHQAAYGGEVGSTGLPGDAFIAKYNATGILIWSTYLGGTDDEGITAIGLDTTGRLYVTGWTRSANGISTSGTAQPIYGGGNDAFLACFDTSGTRIWGTYYGGSGDENANGIGGLYVSPAGDCFITGRTNSSNSIATTGSHKPLRSAASTDVFIAKFNKNGQRIWGSYFGDGTSAESSVGQAIVASGNSLYITGYTSCSAGIASPGAFQAAKSGGTSDAYVARFDTSGQLAWGTYYGGTAIDRGLAINANANGVYVGGITTSTTGIASSAAYQAAIGGSQDIFLACFSFTGQRNWATYYGGTGSDAIGQNLVLDAFGDIYLSGNSNSANNIASAGAIQATLGGSSDVVMAKFNSAGTRLWGTYLGGSGGDFGADIATNGSGLFYLTGRTVSSTNIATAGSQQPSLAGDNDAFVIAVNDCSAVAKPDTIKGLLSSCNGTSLRYIAGSVNNAVSYTWILPAGWNGTSITDTIDVVSGANSGWIKVIAKGICSISDTQSLFVSIAPTPMISPDTAAACFGDSVLLDAGILTGSFQWTQNGTILVGATGTTLKAFQTGNYTIIATNSGCSDTSISAVVTIHPLPVVPSIVRNGQILSLPASYSTYQWFFNGTVIVGATTPTFTYTVDGTYSVAVTDNNGCAGTSPLFNTNGSSVPSHVVSGMIYPNPVIDGSFNVSVSRPATMQLHSIDGRKVREATLTVGTTLVPVADLAASVYNIRIVDTTGVLLYQTNLVIE